LQAPTSGGEIPAPRLVFLPIRSDLINFHSGGEKPPEPAGEDACATIAFSKIFDVEYTVGAYGENCLSGRIILVLPLAILSASA